jgi:hypothetical protein
LLEHGERFIQSSYSGKLSAKLKKRRCKRLASGGAAQLVACFLATPGCGQSLGKLGLKPCVFGAARGPLQRGDRLGGSTLHQQRSPENLRGNGVAAIRFQDSGGKALGLVRALHAER